MRFEVFDCLTPLAGSTLGEECAMLLVVANETAGPPATSMKPGIGNITRAEMRELCVRLIPEAGGYVRIAMMTTFDAGLRLIPHWGIQSFASKMARMAIEAWQKRATANAGDVSFLRYTHTDTHTCRERHVFGLQLHSV